MPVHTFTMTSEAAQLARLRQWLREALQGQGVERDEHPQILLAVGEIAANAIEHAYRGRPGQPIIVSLQVERDRLVVEVEDFGEPFDAASYSAPDLGALPEQGLGLHLVKSIADSLAFDVNRERGTRWTLVKYRPGHAPPSGAG
jgi:sigma-B regulation protein RsbU (phosphoserine phosphatase)